MMIFVFGSNLAGRHGKGAALYAKKHYGAEQGVGEGLTGNSYALPSKDEKLKTLGPYEFMKYTHRFLDFAENSEENFLLTPVGCGLAGFTSAWVWSIIKKKGLPSNVYLSPEWVNDHDVVVGY